VNQKVWKQVLISKYTNTVCVLQAIIAGIDKNGSWSARLFFLKLHPIHVYTA
jgi:hypothetical protein